MENKLKPCPFCKNFQYFDIAEDSRYQGEHNAWFVMCEDCFTRGPRAETREEAIEAWNRRAGEGK